jgi:hypothetical protein
VGKPYWESLSLLINDGQKNDGRRRSMQVWAGRVRDWEDVKLWTSASVAQSQGTSGSYVSIARARE